MIEIKEQVEWKDIEIDEVFICDNKGSFEVLYKSSDRSFIPLAYTNPDSYCSREGIRSFQTYPSGSNAPHGEWTARGWRGRIFFYPEQLFRLSGATQQLWKSK